MQKIAVLISGRGSNMLGIAERCRQEQWPARIVAVISNRPRAAGLRAAADLGLATEAIDHTGFTERVDFDAALADRLEALGVDWIVLAGFMRVLGDAFVTRFAGRIVNIHPSLLPAFPGLHTHRRALEAGVRLHGATVHLVTSSLDLGPIVAQAAVPVLDGDDPDRLAERVLAAEHRLYPMAVRWLVEGRILVEGQRCRLREPREGEAQWFVASPPA
ncbi:MAG: phosphoribosylglycinamide formyltransferase [Burkholderiaceae bacterium]